MTNTCPIPCAVRITRTARRHSPQRAEAGSGSLFPRGNCVGIQFSIQAFSSPSGSGTYDHDERRRGETSTSPTWIATPRLDYYERDSASSATICNWRHVYSSSTCQMDSHPFYRIETRYPEKLLSLQNDAWRCLSQTYQTNSTPI